MVGLVHVLPSKTVPMVSQTPDNTFLTLPGGWEDSNAGKPTYLYLLRLTHLADVEHLSYCSDDVHILRTHSP